MAVVSAEFFCLFFLFGGPCFSHSEVIKNNLFLKRSKISKSPTRCSHSDRFVSFSGPLLALIFSLFHNSQQTHILRYNAKTSFLQFHASHFGIKNQSTNHTRFLELTFLTYFYKLSIWGPSSKSSGHQNGTQNLQLSPIHQKVP